ncbi:MAG: hypothetical protein JSW63_10385 [Ignavibacterium sp.]|nr:MAG: hypothetical protein JSW63_10385 [Ignavibacterium sp.]
MYKSILNFFQSPVEDNELTQYKILAKLNEYNEKFRKYKLFPELLQLYHIDNMLRSLYVKYQPYNESLSKGMKTPVIDGQKADVVNRVTDSSDVKEIFELISWAMLHVQTTMEEGIAVYEFVHDNIKIEPALPIRSKKNEGYFIIPDYHNNLLRIFEYSSPRYSLKKKSSKSLKTKLLIQISLSEVGSSVVSAGIKLIERYGQMKDVPVYVCETILDLPFKETVLPIAKSILLGKLNER